MNRKFYTAVEIRQANLKKSPGTTLYFSEYFSQIKELCKGDMVFTIGEKDDCIQCAKICSGCIEQVINFGYGDFDKLKHLIKRPENLIPKYRRLYNLYIHHDLKYHRKSSRIYYLHTRLKKQKFEVRSTHNTVILPYHRLPEAEGKTAMYLAELASIGYNIQLSLI